MPNLHDWGKEEYCDQVLQDLPQFLNDFGNSVSGMKLMALLDLPYARAFALKAFVQHTLDMAIKDYTRDHGGELTYKGYYEKVLGPEQEVANKIKPLSDTEVVKQLKTLNPQPSPTP